ncbi:flagellar basal body P-ring protein FlgI [Cupriavidus basilensis]|uniref:Flagellar P-ring protein n=1 Tax=Cupriavidus basilensis TaxID=68895 RepID=A0ABT6AWU2_9BURK|nr:flagellar basal body P-ring protein FlgI [Cupriavidus basilensis]MDF3836833.1 flagellar basal body P-ring protein FlgI [Cupriavidus basilensis]
MLKRFALLAIGLLLVVPSHGNEVRLKELGRFLGWRDNMLVGYGIVTGLAGSGDSPRNRATRQALSNALSQFDFAIPADQVQSRNVAVVMISASLPPTANVGDKLDVTVTSIGDARSLAGGSLMMTALKAPDKRVYALAQGPVSVGGYRYEANGNLVQKNHPTVGMVPSGGTVEIPIQADIVADNGYLTFVLKDADVTTAERIAARLNAAFGRDTAYSKDATAVAIRAPASRAQMNQWLARIEGLTVMPDRNARVVVNERTGTVVAGSDVRIDAISLSHGDIRVTVETEYTASQPNFIGYAGPEVRSLIIGNSKLTVDEKTKAAVATFPNTTVSDLVHGLSKMNVGTRDTIAILQALKAAGALHAELIIQ